MFSKLKSLLSAAAPGTADVGGAHKKEGDDHLKHDRLGEAIACYRRAIAIDPDNVDAGVALGFALSERQQYREAEQRLRHALSIDPRIADAHYILGTIAKSEGDDALSIEEYTRAIELKSDFEYAYRDLVAALIETRQFQKAKETLTSAISAFPDSAEFCFYLGNLRSQEGDNDGAVSWYRNALALYPGSAETHRNLAHVLGERGEIDESIAAYRAALSFDPTMVDAHIALGARLQGKGKPEEAAECYERAVSLQPEATAAHVQLGIILQGRGRVDKAIACFRRAIALEPGSATTHQYLGNALLERGATQEAIACYEEVATLLLPASFD